MIVDGRYHKILESGFKRFPKRKENFEKMKKFSKTGEKIDWLPGILYVEIIGRCNFKCNMCDLQGLPGRTRGEDMSFDQFKKFMDAHEGTYEVKLPGVGEGFLHKNIIDCVKFLSDRDIWVHLPTNGSLLHRQEFYKKIIDAGVGELTCSIDGATKEVFEKIRIGAVFSKLEKNFKLVNDYCNEKKLTRTRAFTTLQSNNRPEVKDIVKLSADWGFKRLSFQCGIFDWGNENLKDKIESIRPTEITYDEGMELVELGKKCGIEVTFIDFKAKYTKKNICPYPWERSSVASGMRYGPCCHIWGNHYFLGDASKPVENWNGELYQKFRKDHLTGNIPEVCKYCYSDCDK